MPRSRIPSPARSQGVISTPRRDKLRRRTRSVCSPAQCNVPVRLSSLVSESYKLSPMPKRQSVLTDETDIEIAPGRQSWWKKLGDDDSRDIMEVLGTKDMAEIKNLANEFDVEVLSQEKKNYTLDLPESSDGESITSIVIPQQKLFTQKGHNNQKDFAQILNSRDSQSKHKSHINHDKDIKVAPKNLFNQPSKPRNRPVFPAALLNISANKTMNKTKEMTVAEVKGQVRSLFGNRPGTKRKNMFADFIVSDSEDDIPDIQPKVFGFQRNVKKNRRESSSSRASRHSPTSSIDLELDDWKLLPSSTMVGNQLEDTTPVKRARLSKLSEVKESVTMSTINKTMNKTKQLNKSINAKNKSKISSNSKLDVESSKLQDDNENKETNNQVTNSSNSRLTRNKSKSIRETSLTEANRSKTINKSKNITNKDQSIVKKVEANQENINLPQDGGNIQNALLNEGEDNEDFTLEYENDDEQHMECEDNNPNECPQSEATNNTLKQTSNENINILDEENQDDHLGFLQEGTCNRQESTNKTLQIQNNMDIDMLDGNATKEPQQLNNEKEFQNINSKQIDEIENVKNKTKVSIHNTSKKHNKSKQNNVETEIEDNQENHNNTRNQIENKNSQNESNIISQEIGYEVENYDKNKPISKVNEEIENHEEENVNSEQNSTEDNKEENKENVCDEDENESQEAQNKSQDKSDQIDSEQQQNETEEQEEMEDDNQELNESDKDDEDDSDTQQDDESVTSNHEEQNESTLNKTDEQQNESIVSNENEQQAEESEEQDEENEEQEDENEDEDEKIEDEDEETEDHVMENDVENEDQEMESEKEEEDDEEQHMENDHRETNSSEVESNEEESEQVEEDNDNEDEEENDNEDEEENYNEDEEVSGNKSDESPNITHDTTGKHRNIQKVTSPEAILHDKTNQIDSFMAEGRNTSVRKTKSIMIKTLNIRPSLAPVRESTGFSDGTRNSSADNSGWDSHRTTRKTLRQTFGKDFTPRKSLRALVMEKSAKRHTNFVEKEAELAENEDNKIPQANSTELPHFDSYEDPEPAHVDETAVSTVEESNHEEHDISKRTRQTTLEMYLEKIKQDNLERRRRIEEQVRNSLKTTTQTYNPFLVPRKPVRRVKPAESKPHTKQTKPLVSMDMLPAEVLEDLKYKPPKRFKPKNASWVTKRLYKFLETKLEPKYDYKARVRAEKLVETIFNFTKDVKKHHVAPLQMVDALKFEMARLNIVTTHFDFYEFIQNYMPREIRIKVNPDVVNNIPLPKQGVFADIIT